MNRDPDALLAALFGHGATQPQLTQAEDSEYPYDEEQEEYAGGVGVDNRWGSPPTKGGCQHCPQGLGEAPEGSQQ